MLSRVLACLGLATAVSLVSLPSAANAASKKPSSSAAIIKVVDLSRVLVSTYNGQNITCYRKNAKTIYLGKLSKNRKKFLSEHLKFKNKVQDLKKRIKSASKKQAAALSAQLRSMIDDDAAKKSACVNSGVTPPPDGPIFPINTAESLAALARPVTATDIAYLVEKAGYGMGDAENYLLRVGAEQGIHELVAEFMRDKGEDLTLESRLRDRLDDVVANNPVTPTVTIAGSRKALLDWTIFSRNPYRMRMLYFLFSLFPTNSNYLNPNANQGQPNQNDLWWDYIQVMRNYASYPDIPRLAGISSQHVSVLYSAFNNDNDKTIPNNKLARNLLDRAATGAFCYDANGNKIIAYLDERDGSDAQSDVNRIARRLTGWRVGLENTGLNNGDFWTAKFDPAEHAEGPEMIFEGGASPFSAEEDRDTIPGIYNNNPCAAYNLSKLLLQEFVTPNPPRGLIIKFAELIKASSFNLEYPMTVLLKSEAFYHPGYRNTVTKTPLELMVEFIKTMRLENAAYVYYTNNNGALISDRLPTVETYLNNMEWDVSRPRFYYMYRREYWENTTAVMKNLDNLARFMQDALTQNRPGTVPPLAFLPLNQALPQGSLTHDQLITYVMEKFGVSFNAEQIEEINIFLTFQFDASGTYTRVPAYDNTVDLQRRTKGLGMLLIGMAQPGFLLK